MARRLPSLPPTLPGFTYVRLLGSGGFADVFLYEQNLPRRQVAVKVLLAEIVDDVVRHRFQAEANTMAQLSSHPAILTVYQAGVCSDGRPYFVMEFCSVSLGSSYRSQVFRVSDALKIGIKIASAIESAHRMGVIHRDIKPSNILMTVYGHPVLSDFGIAGTFAEREHFDVPGLSIPWSAPEVLRHEVSGSISSEIWSLAATIFSLIAGRSPFELPDRQNSSALLIRRIVTSHYFPMVRSDVPASLSKALDVALTRDPKKRQSSALEFLRQLQAVETEIGFTQTPVDIAVIKCDVFDNEVNNDFTLTRIGNEFGSAEHAVKAKSSTKSHNLSLSLGKTFQGNNVHSVLLKRSQKRQFLLGSALIFVSGLLCVMMWALIIFNSSVQQDIPRITSIEIKKSGNKISFRWANPGISEDDRYLVRINDRTQSLQKHNGFEIESRQTQRTCISVAVNRGGRNGQASENRCVDTKEFAG